MSSGKCVTVCARRLGYEESKERTSMVITEKTYTVSAKVTNSFTSQAQTCQSKEQCNFFWHPVSESPRAPWI
eukprot:6238008-Amphidinium_carterae.1